MKEKMQSISHKIEEPPTTEVNHSANVAPIALHVKRLRDVQRHHPHGDPTRNSREHDQQHTPEERPNGSAMPVPSECARWKVRDGPWLWRAAKQTCLFPQTTCHPLLLQERQGETGNGGQQVPDKCVLSGVERRAMQHRRCGLHDNVLIPINFFEYISYWMCNQFALHMFRIDSGRTKIKQGKTDGLLHVCESHHKDPYKLDLTKPRLALYKQK